jgi:hypothetical protein
MRINYFDTRNELIKFFIEQANKSFGFYDISPNGDFFRTSESKWNEQENSVVYPDWSVLFNIMRDDRIEFKETIYKLI